MSDIAMVLVDLKKGTTMSDTLYAVQFRSMHTAIHNIAVFDVESLAKKLFDFVKETNEIPEDCFFDSTSFVDLYEIDFRNPPTHHKDCELSYVNNPTNTIPDAYNI